MAVQEHGGTRPQANSLEHGGGEDKLHQAAGGRVQVAGGHRNTHAAARSRLRLRWHTPPPRTHAHAPSKMRAHVIRIHVGPTVQAHT